MNKRLWILLVLVVAIFFGGMFWYKNSSTEQEEAKTDYVELLDINKLITKDDIIKAREEAEGVTLSDEEKDNIIEEHYQGNIDSDVIVILYEDFACSHCQAFHTYTDSIMEDYSDRVLFIMRDFSLNYPNSTATLSAAEAVAKLGGNDAFWKMSKQLFQDETWVGQAVAISERKELFNTYAENSGVDVDKFNELLGDYKNNGILDKIDRDKAVGEKAGVTGTPTWIVNGEKLDSISDSDIRDAIDKALESSQE